MHLAVVLDEANETISEHRRGATKGRHDALDRVKPVVDVNVDAVIAQDRCQQLAIVEELIELVQLRVAIPKGSPDLQVLQIRPDVAKIDIEANDPRPGKSSDQIARPVPFIRRFSAS